MMKRIIFLCLMLFHFNTFSQTLIELQKNHRVCVFDVSSYSNTKSYDLNNNESFSGKKDYTQMTFLTTSGVKYYSKTMIMPSLTSILDKSISFMYDPSVVTKVNCKLSYRGYSGYKSNNNCIVSYSNSSTNKEFTLSTSDSYLNNYTSTGEGRILSEGNTCIVVFHELNFRNKTHLIDEERPAVKKDVGKVKSLPYLYKPSIFKEIDSNNAWVIQFTNGLTIEVKEGIEVLDLTNENMVSVYVKGERFKSKPYIKAEQEVQLISKI